MELFSDITFFWLIIFFIAGFSAGYIDSIAGGGGMIQVPILLLSGISPLNVLASNKIASLFGVLMATIKYALSKKISWRVVKIAIIPCLIASYIGSSLVMFLSDEIIKWLILIAILVAMIFLFKKSKKIVEEKIEFDNSVAYYKEIESLDNEILAVVTMSYKAFLVELTSVINININTLHKVFINKRVNMVNERKEFFNVTLDEIKKEVEEIFIKLRDSEVNADPRIKAL